MDFNKFKPMLAAQCGSVSEIKFPVIVSPKIDGIRCVCHPTLGPVTRSLKVIPNRHIRISLECLIHDFPEYIFDGELVNGDFQGTQSSIMSYEGEPRFKYMIFDIVNDLPYSQRLTQLNGLYSRLPMWCIIVPQREIHTIEEFIHQEIEYVNQGNEGLMYRTPDSPYKFGRSTWNQQYLIKVKRFVDREAVVIGYEEFMHNANEPTVNELGYTERSSHKENMVPMNTLGALIVQDTKFKVPFNIGTGFTAMQREVYWCERHSLVGRVVNYKYQEHGTVDKPRIPVFRGWRKD